MLCESAAPQFALQRVFTDATVTNLDVHAAKITVNPQRRQQKWQM